MKYATLPVGYDRCLAGIWWKRCSISPVTVVPSWEGDMDMCMVDVTGLEVNLTMRWKF